MPLSIRPIDPVSRPDFAGEISGLHLRETMSPEQVAAMVEGMDKFAVLVLRDQQSDDAQQLASIAISAHSKSPISMRGATKTGVSRPRSPMPRTSARAMILGALCVETSLFLRG